MKYNLTPQQRAEYRAEYSRKYHLEMTRLDKLIRELQAQADTMPIAELTERINHIEALRTALRVQWERSK